MLTRRQRDYLTTLLDLYPEAHVGVHHTQVAKRLGVGDITAYEMLRLLDDYGMLVSEFVPPVSGPGRATLVFRPTEQALTMMSELAGIHVNDDWELAKKRLLAAVVSRQTGDYTELIESLLQRLEQPRPALFFVADMLTTAILVLYQAAGRATEPLLEQLQRIGFKNEHGLGLLNGLILGLSLVERTNRTVVNRLFNQADDYNQALARLGDDHRRQLLEFAQEVVQLLRQAGRDKTATSSRSAT